MKWFKSLTILILMLLLTRSNSILAQTGGTNFGSMERISVTPAGQQANAGSEYPLISGDGRFVVYHSNAGNLVPGDTNNTQDVFLYDRLTRTTQRVSLGEGGVQGNKRSSFPDISSDGRYVAFHSEASNLVANDTNNAWDVFFRDMQTGQVGRASVTSGGQGGNGTSIFPDISGDGRFITFYSEATNLVVNDTNGVEDIFLHNRLTQTTARISVSSGGGQSNGSSIFPDISADGRYIVYESAASNLVPGDTNNVQDIFLYDRLNGTTQLISLTVGGQQSNGRASYPIISGNNRFVTYTSYGSNMHPDDPDPTGDIYVRDLVAGTTELISRGLNNQPSNGESHYPTISDNGRFVAYHSLASNLVSGDTNNVIDVFVYDRQTQSTRRVSRSVSGGQANGPSSDVTISGNGRFLAFYSHASNLVIGDTNGASDIFLYLDLPFRVHIPPVYRQ